MTRAASRAFSQRLHEEAPSVVIVRRILLFFLSIHVILATISVREIRLAIANP